jgi:hypothetical protein
MLAAHFGKLYWHFKDIAFEFQVGYNVPLNSNVHGQLSDSDERRSRARNKAQADNRAPLSRNLIACYITFLNSKGWNINVAPYLASSRHWSLVKVRLGKDSRALAMTKAMAGNYNAAESKRRWTRFRWITDVR